MSEQNVKGNRASGIRHAAVTHDLTEGITSGRFPVGSLLPTELELCEHYGASRHTIRVAIGELVEQGLISRRKRAGTRVEARRPPGNYRQSLTSLDDLIQFGAAHTRVVQETGALTVGTEQALSLGCAEGSRWLRISSLRLDGSPDAPPIGWTDVYIDPAYTRIPELACATPDALVSTLIEEHYDRRIAEINQDVEAVALPARLAATLRADAGSPALRILRRYLDRDGKTFEISESIHPAGRFTASSRLRRSRE